MDGSASDGVLRVHVEDGQGARVDSVTLQCPGDCVDLEVVARGGRAPYTFVWEDGTLGATRHVCLDADAMLRVSATDTEIAGDEFVEHPAQTVSADVMVTVLDCDGPPRDAGVPDDGGMPDEPCEDRAKAGSFDPVVKWSFDEVGSLTTPLVANLTDDNGDGVVDTLDTPDVVIVKIDAEVESTELVVLDGGTGTVHLRIPNAAEAFTPALGDIDGDRQVDIVMARLDRSLAAFHGDGSLIWQTEPAALVYQYVTAISLADLNHDGAPEIVAGNVVFDARGVRLWQVSTEDTGMYNSPVAVDLDGDGYLEVIWGGTAYRHDGSAYYRNPDVFAATTMNHSFFSAVADLDGDDAPEIVVVAAHSLFVLDRHGEIVRSAPYAAYALPFPPAIADLDGDGTPEILVGDGMRFTAYTAALETLWSMPVVDMSGIAAGTAFDFLGDGTTEAMYGAETVSWGFDGLDGHVIFMQPRASGTAIEYPSVADVDNDGSADILIVSNNNGNLPVEPEFGLRVISDRDARWVPARRILNQEAYHVTNVNDDGTIPANERPHWQLNNSFRAQAQIHRGGAVCLPRGRE